MTDLECAKAIASGDEHVTQDFYNKHRAKWEGLVAAKCRNPELEEEVIGRFNEKFVHACSAFEGRSTLATFLTGALWNLCKDEIRKKARGPETEPIDETVEQSPAKIRRDPRDYIKCNELFRMGFADLQASLSPRDWAIFMLRLRRVRQDQIAKRMKVTPAAISQRIKAVCKSFDDILLRLADGPHGDCIDYFWSAAADVTVRYEKPTGGNAANN